MHIGLIIYGSLETVSGGYLYDRLLVEHLRAIGQTVTVFSLPFRPYPLLLGDNFRRNIERSVIESGVDILIQDELNHPSLLALNSRIRRRLGCPLVSIVHHLRSEELHPSLQRRIYREIERRYLNSVDAFVFNSDSTRVSVEALLDARKPFIVAPPGSDRLGPVASPELVSARALRAGPVQVLFLGNVIPRKGLHTLLEALSRVPAHQWRLTVAGDFTVDAPYAHRVRAQANRLNFTNQVRFTGKLTDAEIVSALEMSQLMVVPSSFEGYGIVYAEAMRWGLPVIASTAGGAVEIVDHGVNGALVSPDHPLELARWIGTLIDDRAVLERLSLAALQRARSHPRWSDTVQSIGGFLHSIAG